MANSGQMSYSKKEVIELAEQVLGAHLEMNRPIPLPILDALGLYREWNSYKERV